MISTNKRPRWWQLYLIFPLLIALFIVDHQLKISTRGHQVVQILIILLVFGLIHLWLKANARALSRMDQQAYSGMSYVIQISSGEDIELSDQKRSILQLPTSEIRGVLSDSMDMGYINAESPTREIHKN